MKKILLLLLLLYLPGQSHTQDILYFDDSLQVQVKITGMRQGLITYYNLFDPKKRRITLPRNALLGYYIQEWKMKPLRKPIFPPQDIVVLKQDTMVLPVNIVADTDTSLQYYLLTDSTKSLLDISKKEIINYGQEIDFYRLGQQDAKKYYSTAGPITFSTVSGFILGPFGFIPRIPPKVIKPDLSTHNNPNAYLYQQNDQYTKGYLHKAHKKLGGAIFAVGVSSLLITYIAFNSNNIAP